jgi:hypothetical protein
MTIDREGQIVIQPDVGGTTPLYKAIQKQGKRRESHPKSTGGSFSFSGKARKRRPSGLPNPAHKRYFLKKYQGDDSQIHSVFVSEHVVNLEQGDRTSSIPMPAQIRPAGEQQGGPEMNLLYKVKILAGI